MAPLRECSVEQLVVQIYTSLSFALAMGAGSPSDRLFTSPSVCGSNAFTAIIVSTRSTNPIGCPCANFRKNNIKSPANSASGAATARPPAQPAQAKCKAKCQTGCWSSPFLARLCREGPGPHCILAVSCALTPAHVICSRRAISARDEDH